MTLAESIMTLKGKTYYSELSRRCDVSATTISKIARGIITDPPLFTIVYIAKAFNMSIMRLMAPINEYKDKHIISQQRTKPNGEWIISTVARV